MELVEQIQQAEADDMEQILRAVLQRYAELFPGWEITTISVEKCMDKNEQLDQIISVLERLKEKN